MWCPTKNLTNFISEKYIKKYKALDGVRFLKKSLHKDSRHQHLLLNLEGQLYDLKKKEIVGILEDQYPVRDASNRLLQFLEYLKNDERTYVFVYKSSGLDKKVDGVIEGNNPNNYLNKSKDDKKGFSLDINFYSVKKKIRFLVIGFISCFLIFIFFKSSVKSSSPLDQVTSWTNENSDLWAIHLRSFATLENAVRERDAFQNRDISIIKLNDERFYLFIFHDDKASAEDEYSGRSIKKKWINSRIIPVDLCTPTKSINSDYYLCQ